VTTEAVSIEIPIPVVAATPLRQRAGWLTRFAVMAKTGVAMMFHDKLKLCGTLFGVVFAVVLANQQLGTFLGLLYKNVMLVENVPADLWILPSGSETLDLGRLLSTSALDVARGNPDVAAAEPLIYFGAAVKLPDGGTQAVSLIGTAYPRYLGGPWNLVAGETSALSRPDTMIFEDSERETLGGLNVGSTREVSGRRVTVGGFTWGLIPFGPSFAFADYELARELSRLPRDQTSVVLVKIRPGADLAQVKADLARRAPETVVFTRAELKGKIVKYILTKTAIGITFGTSTVFGLIVGFVIVGLSMFSAVVDNIREFGTLKAIGATNTDLAMLLVTQSVIYAVLGSLLGLTLVAQMARGIRSAKLALNLPPPLVGGTFVVMILMCMFASSLALLRLRKVEPAMVFR
jgi:putative ABC transport system permease protein